MGLGFDFISSRICDERKTNGSIANKKTIKALLQQQNPQDDVSKMEKLNKK
jgi:hypothetical protein